MELRDGLNSVLQWSRINVSIGRDQAGHDLVLLTGPEPDMAWHRFSDAVGDLAVELGVTRMFGARRISVRSAAHPVAADLGEHAVAGRPRLASRSCAARSTCPPG